MHTLFNNIIFGSLLSLLKSTREISNLSTSNPSTSDFKAVKSIFLANFDVSIPAALFKLDFVA